MIICIKYIYSISHMNTVCLSCFAIAVIKYNDQGNLYKNVFNCAYTSRGLESMMILWSEGMAAGTAERSHLKLQAGITEHLGNKVCLLRLQRPPSVTHFFQQGHAS